MTLRILRTKSAGVEIKRNDNVPNGDREGRGNNGGYEDKEGNDPDGRIHDAR